MKFFIWLLLIFACHGFKISEDNIITELCFKPSTGPPCQKLKSFYWAKENKTCVLTTYLLEPCGFFQKLETCKAICTKESWTLPDLERYVGKLP